MTSATSTFGSTSIRHLLRRWIAQEMRENVLLYWLICSFFVATTALSLALGEPLPSFLWIYLLRTLRAIVIVCSAALLLAAVRALLQKEEDSPLRYLWKILLTRSNARLLGTFSFGCILLTLFMGAFLFNKTAIPLIAPYSWDPVFTQWDMLLFGGRHPWEVLLPIFGNAPAIYIFDFLYGLWVPLVFLAWAGLLASSRVPVSLRRQFWLSTITSWMLIGLVLATIFSSVGPCFAPALFPGLTPAYAPLNAYLAHLHSQFPLGSSLGKDYLWSIYSGALDEPGGISAMPSMHNAQTMLFVLAAFRIDRRLGLLMSVYAVLIFIGSIMLAWHYAVDGIVGAGAAFAVWFGCGLLVNRNRAGAVR